MFIFTRFTINYMNWLFVGANSLASCRIVAALCRNRLLETILVMMLNGAFLPSLRDGPLENFFEGGKGGGRSTKKNIRAREN